MPLHHQKYHHQRQLQKSDHAEHHQAGTIGLTYLGGGDEGYGGEFTLFIEPFKGTYDDFFYYVKKLENGSIEITGEGYIVTDKDSLASHKRDAKKELGDMCPAYYWLDENDKQIDKTYL